MNEIDLTTLSKEELIRLVKVYSRLFLALDGFWFLAVEDRFGYQAALDADIDAWEGYFPYEAKMLRKAPVVSTTPAGDTPPLESQGVHQLVPSVIFLPHQVRRGNPHIIEEDLIEYMVAGIVYQGSYRNQIVRAHV